MTKPSSNQAQPQSAMEQANRWATEFERSTSRSLRKANERLRSRKIKLLVQNGGESVVAVRLPSCEAVSDDEVGLKLITSVREEFTRDMDMDFVADGYRRFLERKPSYLPLRKAILRLFHIIQDPQSKFEAEWIDRCCERAVDASLKGRLEMKSVGSDQWVKLSELAKWAISDEQQHIPESFEMPDRLMVAYRRVLEKHPDLLSHQPISQNADSFLTKKELVDAECDGQGRDKSRRGDRNASGQRIRRALESGFLTMAGKDRFLRDEKLETFVSRPRRKAHSRTSNYDPLEVA